MQYALLIYDDESMWAKMAADERGALMDEYRAFSASLVASGQMRGGEPLTPSSSATTVRVRSGDRVVTDGPFAETREQLGGFYVIEAKDLDEAVAIASRIPSARFGTIEVRPIAKMGG
jgi:hypothetical protein